MASQDFQDFQKSLLECQSEAAPYGILVVDEHGKMISFNRRFIEMWGIPKEVAESRSDEAALQAVFNKLVYPEEFLARVKHLYQHREEKSREEIALKDGRAFDRYSAPVNSANGTYYGRVWYFHDITELKRTTTAESEKREALKKYEFIADTSKEFMTLIDRVYRYEAVNASYAKAQGKTKEEIVGLTVKALWGEQSFQEKIKGPLDQCLTGKEVQYASWLEFPKTGQRYFETYLYPYKTKEGVVTHAVVITRDITERKELENQIVQAEKMALVGQLSSGIAHEINNPLAGILTTAQMALSQLSEPSGALREDLKVIENSALRCKKIVSNLLTFSRAHSFHITPISAYDILESAVALVANAASLNHVSMVNLVDPNTPLVKASSLELQLIFVNLMHNSIQAMPEGGTLSISSSKVNHNYLDIRFEDTGEGMDPDIMKKIFNPFFTTKPAGQGTGLGLSVSLSLAQRFGGAITAHSKGKGKGAAFIVTLPAAPETKNGG